MLDQLNCSKKDFIKQYPWLKEKLDPKVEGEKNMDPNSKKFITLQELCELLGIGKQTYYKLLKKGYLPEPIRCQSGRPCFPVDVAEECVKIIETRCGKNGMPLVLNRRPSIPKKEI